MQDAKQALRLVKRAIAIADSKEFDEDAVRRVLDKAEQELKDAGLRRDDTGDITGQLSEAA